MTFYQVFGRKGEGDVFECIKINKEGNDPYITHEEPNLEAYLGKQLTVSSDGKLININEVKWLKTTVTQNKVIHLWSNN